MEFNRCISNLYAFSAKDCNKLLFEIGDARGGSAREKDSSPAQGGINLAVAKEETRMTNICNDGAVITAIDNGCPFKDEINISQK